MSRVLKLFNSFTKANKIVVLEGKQLTTNVEVDKLTRGSFYICGPTVYSDSHLGHALTYVRADLFRRVMRSVFNVKLTTVMNITDVDDKILARIEPDSAQNNSVDTSKDPKSHPFNEISDKYFSSFMNDMEYIRVEPPDLILKVSKHIHLITNYIRTLEERGHVYITSEGDIYFHTPSIKNYVGRGMIESTSRIKIDENKRDPRDFVVWKAAKPGEPVWTYKSSTTGKIIPGRPGWHVQCSAMASSIFGDELDFHYGGRDLSFPHHYNEEACCCAFHGLDTSQSLHVWSKHWLHSGHVVIKDEKMSKSLGNVVSIRDFVKDTSINALRLMCVTSRYGSEVQFDSALLDRLKGLDHKLNAFINTLYDALYHVKLDHIDQACTTDDAGTYAFIQKTQSAILEGICDNMDLTTGSSAIISLSKYVYSKGVDKISPHNLVTIWNMVSQWCSIFGLEYRALERTQDHTLVNLIRLFRQNVRAVALTGLKSSQSNDNAPIYKSILSECDNVRSRLDRLGFIERDTSASEAVSKKSKSKLGRKSQ